MLKLAQPIEESEDERTLARAATGDTAAFGSLVRQHQSMVYSLALRFLREPSAAEDVAQDAFLELYRNLGRLQSPSHVRFWLRRVTANRCIDRIRQRTAHAEDAFDEDVPEPEAPVIQRDLLLESRLRDLVAELTPNARMVVILRYQEDLEPAEIAETLGMPLNTVKSHLRRSLAALRAKLPSEVRHGA
jgi:RNA polymerase sigma-70 factor (ECF subfamily)